MATLQLFFRGTGFPMSHVLPCRAFVRPRVLSPITGDTLLLENEIAELLDGQRPLLVTLAGPRCSGKTTALQYLAATLNSTRLVLLDSEQSLPNDWQARNQVVVYVTSRNCLPDIQYTMAPWTVDDVLEYLLKSAPQHTGSVLNRIRTAPDQYLTEGSPELIEIVVQQMIADSSITSIRSAFRNRFSQFLTDTDVERRLGMFALAAILGFESEATRLILEVGEQLPGSFLRMFHLDGPRLVLAATHVLSSIAAGPQILQCKLPQDLITECGAQFVHRRDAEVLQRILDQVCNPAQAMAASILYAAGEGLAEIEWSNADLRNADLRGASFHLGSTRCGLVDSPFPSHGTRTGFYTNDYDDQSYRPPEEIRKADLRGADLRGANIQGVDFYLVDLRDATYDRDQLQHLIRCDAILHDRTIN